MLTVICNCYKSIKITAFETVSLKKYARLFSIMHFYFMCLAIKYDAEKEAKQFLEARQRELQRIEEAKQKIADQGKGGKS